MFRRISSLFSPTGDGSLPPVSPPSSSSELNVSAPAKALDVPKGKQPSSRVSADGLSSSAASHDSAVATSYNELSTSSGKSDKRSSKSYLAASKSDAIPDIQSDSAPNKLKKLGEHGRTDSIGREGWVVISDDEDELDDIDYSSPTLAVATLGGAEEASATGSNSKKRSNGACTTTAASSSSTTAKATAVTSKKSKKSANADTDSINTVATTVGSTSIRDVELPPTLEGNSDSSLTKTNSGKAAKRAAKASDKESKSALKAKLQETLANSDYIVTDSNGIAFAATRTKQKKSESSSKNSAYTLGKSTGSTNTNANCRGKQSKTAQSVNNILLKTSESKDSKLSKSGCNLPSGLPHKDGNSSQDHSRMASRESTRVRMRPMVHQPSKQAAH